LNLLPGKLGGIGNLQQTYLSMSSCLYVESMSNNEIEKVHSPSITPLLPHYRDATGCFGLYHTMCYYSIVNP